MTAPLVLPLAGWADAQLRVLAEQSGSTVLAALSGAQLLGERAALNGFTVPGAVSAGGGCRLFAARDGHVALTLARDADREMLPALFGDAAADEGHLAAYFAQVRAGEIVAQGRLLGLAIAHLGEHPVSPACAITTHGLPSRTMRRHPLVIDLTALWAGPLAAHLLELAGADVVKVESRNRPDRMREGDPALFARLNQNKANVAFDLRDGGDRDALIALIRRADIVLEAARLRALPQLGIDPDQLVRETPGLSWVTITGHGATGDAGGWIGFGDDCSVAGGLSAALFQASGTIGFGGDACADPLAGLLAARIAWEQWAQGCGARLVLSMSGTVAQALAEERARDEDALMTTLRNWPAARGQPFPAVEPHPHGPVAAIGQDNGEWITSILPC